MKRISYSHLYNLGFIFWSVLLLIRLYEIFPYEKISQISAQIGLFLHFFMLLTVSKVFTYASKNDRKILFWLIPINTGLFLNDLAFYCIIYSSKNYNLNLSFINFVIDIIPYSIWNISVLIFLITLVRDIFTLKNFIKLLSMLMLINFMIIFIFFDSVPPAFNYLSWQNLSQIISSLIELIIYNLSITCLIYSKKKDYHLLLLA